MLCLLVEARKATGATQVELAKRLNRPQSYVSKFENGDRRIDLVEFIEICVALDTDPLPIMQTVWASMGRS
jgi:transcriptional regulator with XRE-family HTH domain